MRVWMCCDFGYFVECWVVIFLICVVKVEVEMGRC